MNLTEALKHERYGPILLKFETHWNMAGQYEYTFKMNYYLAYLFDDWNVGLINLEEYRDLITIDLE